MTQSWVPPVIDSVSPEVEQCLQDSSVLDVDFSEWDKVFRLVVRSEDMPTTGFGGDPVFAVEFRGMREIAFKFKEDLSPLPAGEYHGWILHGVEIQSEGSLQRLTTSPEFGCGPAMNIVYESAGCVLVPPEILSRLAPRNAPPAALERRGLFGLFEIVKGMTRK